MIKQLTSKHLTEFVDLFVSVFQEDGYYRTLFPDENTRKQNIRAMINDILQNGFKYLTIYGDYRHGELIAFLVTFDYFTMMTSDKSVFLHMFDIKGSTNIRELPYFEALHQPILSLCPIFSHHVIYLLSIGVRHDLQQKGIGSRLLRQLIAKHDNDYIVSDVSNVHSLSMYERLRFDISPLDTDYYFVLRTPKI